MKSRINFLIGKRIFSLAFFVCLTLIPNLSLAADPTISNITSNPGPGVVNISGSAISTAGLITNVGYQVDTNTGSFTDATLSNQIQAGNIDDSFFHGNGSGVGLWKSTASAIVIQPDGKILIGGAFASYNGIDTLHLARLNSDGSLDRSFDTTIGANGTVTAIAIQSNGKIIIGGSFTTYGGATTSNLARLNADGSLDISFNSGGAGVGGTSSAVNAVTIQPDGKIIIAGSFTTYNGTTVNRVTRLNADGSLDTSFNSGGAGANGTINSLAIQASDGKIIIGGAFTTYNGTGRTRLARLNTDGTLDTGFTVGTGANSTVSTIGMQSDNKIIIGGALTTYNGTGVKYLARLNIDGSLDTGFNSGGAGASSTINSLVVRSDDKIMIAGAFSTYNSTTSNRLARLNSDGTLDVSFTMALTTVGTPSVSTIALQNDNKVIASGSILTILGFSYLNRFNVDGSADIDFNPSSGLNNETRNLALQSDGKIIASGRYAFYSTTSIGRIARLNIDGTLDPNFNLGGLGADGVVNALATQPDDKIIIGGNIFSSFNGVSRNNIARLNADGSLDTTFDVGTGLNSSITFHGIVVQPDGKILIGGQFTSYNGTPINYLARLNADGSLDTGFNSGGSGPNLGLFSIFLQPDGKILIGGQFTSYNGTSVTRMMRLNSDGSLDTTFNSGGAGANGSVVCIGMQSNGKIIISGNTFTSYNGVTQNNIARLNADGTLDTSFDSGTGANGGIHVFAIQPDDKIVLAGQFTSYNGVPANGSIRLNADGSLDTSFNFGTGLDSNNLNTMNSVILKPDGKILLGGLFSSYNSVPVNFILRLYSLNSSSFSASIPTTGLTPGTHTLYLKSADNAANTNTISTTFTVPDTTNPVITLKGLSNFSINQGESYTDLGATASDNVDGDITSNITVHNSLNSSVLGTYSITYDVSDAAGNHAAQVTRTITVQAPATASTSGTIPVASLSSPVCTSVTYGDYSASCFAGYQYRPIISRTPESCVTTAIQEENTRRTCLNVANASYTNNNLAISSQPSIVTIGNNDPINDKAGKSLASRLSGRILLQVQDKGQAWYVNPTDSKRYSLGSPDNAFSLMRELALGISNDTFNSFKNNTAPKRLSGRILLKVEDSGKAYYVNPTNLKLYYLGRPADAFNVMRTLGLGITNSDLERIRSNGAN